MGDTSPAPLPSTTVSAPRSPSITPAPAPAPGSASESTPLLSPSPAPNPASSPAPISSQTDRFPDDHPRSVRQKNIVILTVLSFILSITALSLIFATYYAVAHCPHGFYLRYGIQQPLDNIAPIIVLAAILSFGNLVRLRASNRPLPFILNLFLDALISSYNLLCPILALSEIVNYFPNSCKTLRNEHNRTDCEYGVAKIRILLQVTMVVALGLGFVHLVLLVLRCIETWHSRFWRSEGGFPTGRLTFEFSIKLKSDRNDQNNRNDQNDRNNEA